MIVYNSLLGTAESLIIRNYLENRRDHQLQRGAGGSSAASGVILNLIKVVARDYAL